MERRNPVIRNKREIPVNIYRREELLAECSSIQEAAKFFKEYTQDTLFRWSPINKSLWYDEPYSINGNTYYFTTDPEIKENKLKELGEKISKESFGALMAWHGFKQRERQINYYTKFGFTIDSNDKLYIKL